MDFIEQLTGMTLEERKEKFEQVTGMTSEEFLNRQKPKPITKEDFFKRIENEDYGNISLEMIFRAEVRGWITKEEGNAIGENIDKYIQRRVRP